MTNAITPALLVELRHATTHILDALSGLQTPSPTTLQAAHNTLRQRRGDTDGAVRDAIDRYLDDNDRHHGPHTRRRAALQLAATLQLPKPVPETPTSTGEQLTLFEPPDA